MPENEYGLIGLSEKGQLNSHSARGTVTARIEAYYPESQTGFNEPCERAHISVILDTTTGKRIYKHINVMRLSRYDDFHNSHMIEVIATKADSCREWASRRQLEGTSDLFQYSSENDVNWSDILGDIIDNSYLIF